MKTKNKVRVSLDFNLNYTESVNELIEEGFFKTREAIEDYVIGCFMDDIHDFVRDMDMSRITIEVEDE